MGGRLHQGHLVPLAVPAVAPGVAEERVPPDLLGEVPEIGKVGVECALEQHLFPARERLPLRQRDGIAIDPEVDGQREIVRGMFGPAGIVGRGGAGDRAVHQTGGQGMLGVVERDDRRGTSELRDAGGKRGAPHPDPESLEVLDPTDRGAAEDLLRAEGPDTQEFD